jgi:hypothetical protein
MNFPWVICLASEDAAAIAGLRLTSGVEIAETDGNVWLRGPAANQSLAATLQQLPALARYEVKGNRLRKLESRIPSDALPSLSWQPLRTWMQVERPRAQAVSENRPEFSAVRIRLVRSTEEREPNLLLTSLDDWHEFAISAPEIRLRPLRFAVNTDARVLIQGEPLPPLQGRKFVVEANVAVPAGFTWRPAVSSAVLSRLLGARASELAMLYEDGTCVRLPSEQFVAATRAAVRTTAEESHG